MIVSLLRLLIAIVVAVFVGKLVSKVKLPSILGWLIAGMLLGPHAFALVNQDILDAAWYENSVHILECGVGLMIGTELVWNKIKKSGKSIIITTLTQSLGTFLFVSFVFGVVFYMSDIPFYLAFVFGGIALATAPAPALSIVREFKTEGPVTNTLIPMAALDDIVGCILYNDCHCCGKFICRRSSSLHDCAGCYFTFGDWCCSWFAGRNRIKERERYKGNLDNFAYYDSCGICGWLYL